MRVHACGRCGFHPLGRLALAHRMAAPQHRRTRCRHPPEHLRVEHGDRRRARTRPRVRPGRRGRCRRPAPAAARAGAGPAKAATNPRYIVLYKRSLASVTNETNGLERSEGFKSERRYAHAVKGFAARLSTAQVHTLKDDPQVVSVTADRTIQALDTAPLAPGETVPSGISRIEAASAETSQETPGGAIAVIDTGIDLKNPDLNAVEGTNCMTRPRAPRTTTATARTSRARSRPATAAAASSASRPAPSCTRSRSSGRPARAPSRASSAASTGSRPTPRPTTSRSRT